MKTRELVAAAALAVGVMVIATSAPAGDGPSNASLKGTYPFNETIIAGIGSLPPSGSCPTDGAALTITQQFSLTNQGTWAFDGVNRVHMDDTGVQVTVSQGGVIASGYSEAHCDGTYQVTDNRSVSMDYICRVPQPEGSRVEFDVHAIGVISKHMIQVAVPPGTGKTARVTPVHLATTAGRFPIACSIVGENTTISTDTPLN